MPRYQFTGKIPMYYGARKVSAGDLIDLPAAPNRLFVLVEYPSIDPIVPKLLRLPEGKITRSHKPKKEA